MTDTESATPQEQFAAMCPDAPLPWDRGTGRSRWSIVDASGCEVCCFDGSTKDALALINMVIIAVNTCGGYRAEIEWPTRHPPTATA